MKVVPISIFLFLFCLVSCGGDETSNDTVDTISTVEDTTAIDTLQIDSAVFDGVVYTAHAAIDGPDEELWIFQPGEWDGDVTTPFDGTAEMLHIVPYTGMGEGVQEEMSAINRSNFSLYGTFGEFSGPVMVFYDQSKEHVAAQYNVVSGIPQGEATIYEPSGIVFIKSRYENGKRVESIVSPYSVDWTFSQAESSLWIKDVDGHFSKNEQGKTEWSISTSVHEQKQTDNFLSIIMEKGSFNHAFKINDEVFSGALLAYSAPTGVMRENLYYELNFEQGLLHGDVKVYSEWFGMELHEIFNMGVLDSTVYVLDPEQMDGMAKPIIYLYPEQDTKVKVELDVDGEITTTYPAYKDGWSVLAKPDGTLYDATGKEYYALYWEGNNRTQFNVDAGFIVPGAETAQFLEESLAILGLNRREANEFIVFWLPVLEDNPYNLIHFSEAEYAEKAKLTITPEPETLIRVMMVYKPLQKPIDMPLQDLNKLKAERKGFTVVEWGGSLLKTPLEI